MTTIQNHRQNADSLRSELLSLLDGMDYCLDWKPSESEWSAREIAYHIIDTPSGGMAQVVKGISSGEITEYEVWSDRSNVTVDRATVDLDYIQGEIAAFFSILDEALASSTDANLQNRKALMHQRTRGFDGERTMEAALAALDRHWRAHLVQLGELRDALGL